MALVFNFPLFKKKSLVGASRSLFGSVPVDWMVGSHVRVTSVVVDRMAAQTAKSRLTGAQDQKTDGIHARARPSDLLRALSHTHLLLPSINKWNQV